MVKYCDLAICDSVNIEKYIHECYDGKGIKGSSPKTTFIAYGADLTLSKLADDDEKLVSWYKEKGLTKKGYYLVVGRFVPENSFEVMIREFMKSKSEKDFALITNVNDKFLNIVMGFLCGDNPNSQLCKRCCIVHPASLPVQTR